jgi:hypothetical protein
MTAARVEVLTNEPSQAIEVVATEVSSVVKAAQKMNNRQLVSRVKSGFKKIRHEAPYIIVLHARFMALPRGRGASIDGCATWETFCNLKLHRSDRAVRYMLAQALGKGCTAPPIEVSAAPQLAVVADPAPATAEQTVAQAAPKRKNTIADIFVGDWFSCVWSGSAELMRCIGLNKNAVKLFSRWDGERWTQEIGPWRAYGKPQPISLKRKVLKLSEEDARRAYPKAPLEQCPQWPTQENAEACGPLVTELRTVDHAHQWLIGFLRQFEFLAVSTATPEEVFSKLTPDELAILPNCKDWLEQVLNCAMVAK